MFYLKLYESVLDSPKVMGMPPDAIGFWTLALLAASRNPAERGVLPDLEDLAFTLRMDEDKAAAYVETLIARKLLYRREDGKVAVYKWDEYQPRTPAERQRTSRDNRKRPVTPKGKQRPVTESHAASHTVTESHGEFVSSRIQEQSRTEQSPPSPHGGDARPTAKTDGNNQPTPKAAPSPPPGSAPPPPKLHGADVPPEPDRASMPSVDEVVLLAAELFGDAAGTMVSRGERDIADQIEGESGWPRWDCFAAALREVHRRSRKPGARPVENLKAYALTLAADYIFHGIPADVVAVRPAARPAPPLHRAAPDSIFRRVFFEKEREDQERMRAAQ